MFLWMTLRLRWFEITAVKLKTTEKISDYSFHNIPLASGRRSRPSRVKDRAWYHSNRLDQLIHLQPLNCLVMDVRWGKTKVKVENSSKKRFWPSKNRKPELLVSQSYGVWPWLSTDGPGSDSASTEQEKTLKNIKKSGTIRFISSGSI